MGRRSICIADAKWFRLSEIFSSYTTTEWVDLSGSLPKYVHLQKMLLLNTHTHTCDVTNAVINQYSAHISFRLLICFDERFLSFAKCSQAPRQPEKNQYKGVSNTSHQHHQHLARRNYKQWGKKTRHSASCTSHTARPKKTHIYYHLNHHTDSRILT